MNEFIPFFDRVIRCQPGNFDRGLKIVEFMGGGELVIVNSAQDIMGDCAFDRAESSAEGIDWFLSTKVSFDNVFVFSDRVILTRLILKSLLTILLLKIGLR